MPYPNVFYYKLKGSDPIYSFTPQGQLHVGRLIRNQPYWKKPNLAYEEKKKSLILADWTAANWSQAKKEKIGSLIRKLLKDGFDIYIWQKDRAVRLKEEHEIWNEGVRSNMTPFPHATIIDTTITQHKLERDQVHVVDDYWLQALIDQDVTQPRKLASDDLINSGHHKKQIVSLLEKVSPKLEKIEVVEFSPKSNLKISKIKKMLPLVSIDPAYTSLEISPEEVDEFIRKKELIDNEICINVKQLDKIKKLKLISESRDLISANDLQYLFLNIKNLENFMIEKCGISGDIAEDLNLDSLVSASFHHVDISAKTLQHMLINAKNINSLILSSCKISNGTIQALPLTSLESLTIAHTPFPPDTLYYLLAHAEKLKELDLSQYSSSSFRIEMLDKLYLKSLEKLVIGDLVSFSMKNLKNLVGHSENLKILECKVSDEPGEDLNIKSLEILKIRTSNFSAHILKRFTSDTKSLRKLALEGCRITDMTNLNLNSLENLNLTHTGISAKDFQSLLDQAMNLQVMNLVDCEIDGDITKDLKFQFLKTLSIEGEISAKNLQQLLAQAGCLKNLNFQHCKITGEITEDLKLTSLENISGSFSAKNIQQFLIHAENLKELDLGKISIKGDFNIENDLNLKSLEILKFKPGTVISAKTLEHILVNASSLRELDLSFCEIIGDLTENLNLSLLKKLNLAQSTISSKNFQFLLKHPDNLKELNLRCASIDGDLLQGLNLKSLEYVKFPTEISALNLENMLLNAEKIKNLDLTSPIIGKMHFDVHLSALRSFKLMNIQSADNFKHLLSHAKNLENLNISESTINGQVSLKLPSLKNVNLERSAIPLHMFQDSVNLKSIELVECELIDQEGDLNLPSLERLRVKNKAVTAELLQHLLVHAENLQYMTLSIDEIRGRINRDFILTSLKSLILGSFSRFGGNHFFEATNFLQHALVHTSNLETLVLLNCSIGRADFKNINLQSLTLLEFNHAEINLESLHALLSNSPDNLTKIKLSHCKFSGKISANLNLQSLQTIDLFYSDITIDNLNSLITASPNLKELNLGHCPYISNADINKLKEKGIKVTHGDDYSTGFGSGSTKSDGLNLGVSGKPVGANPLSLTSTSNPIQNRLKPESHTAVKVSANTENHIQEFRVSQIFTGRESDPRPNHYRLTVLHQLHLNHQSVPIDDAFLLDNHAETGELDLELTEVNIPKRSDLSLEKEFRSRPNGKDLFYGKIQLDIDENWQSLPSLSSSEEMLQYHVDNPICACEIKYSKRDNLYYIRSADKRSHTVNMDFLLNSRINGNTYLPENLKKLIDHYYDKFEEGTHSFKGPGTGQQYLDSLNKERKGSCMHRSISLIDAIQNHKKEYGLPETITCRYVANDCHAYVEIRLTPDGPWVAYYVGGYGGKLTINKTQMPDIDHIAHFEKQFETWRKEKPRFNTPDAYCQQLASGIRRKQLIELSSTAHVEAMSLTLEAYCHRIHRPVFYIHSPDDLVCSAEYIEKQGAWGELKKGPGGALHDFLMNNQDKANPPILIVNYDHFDADDIIRLNSLLDDEPKADGTPLPPPAVVVGLINPDKPGCYQGEDFYSRFGKGNVETCPFPADQLKHINPMEEKTGLEGDVFPINLYHAPDWEERLLGCWVIKKNNLYFEEGLLTKALNSGRPIEIQNGLWDNASFCHFWDRARALGHIESNGQRFDISASTFIKSEGYDWHSLRERVVFDCKLKDHAEVLNPTLFSELFNRYQCDNSTQQLDTLRGLIEEHHDNILDVNLTRTLGEDEWGALLLECQKHRVILNCHCAPSVSLPKVLGELPETIPASPVSPIVIQSTDVDVTVAQLTENEVWKVIDVSELGSNDLLKSINGKINKKKMVTEFTQSDRALKQALDNHENVILKGRFSTELADALAPLLLERQQGKGRGQLRLITPEASNFNYTGVINHAVSLQEKYAILEKKFPAEKIKALTTLESEPLCKSFARLVSPESSPWQGMRGLSGGIRLQAFDAENSKAKSDAFIRERQDSVNAVLENSPYVFLTGLTGVGKSTFVKKYLASKTTQLYIGESTMQAWAEDQSDKQKILFIDEANLSSRQWSEFEGLFNDPPGILIDGTYHSLTKNHKVIFAGNPLNYGDERKMAPLFERRGNALVFEPMTPEFIYEAILKPVFSNTGIENQSLAIAREILKTYRFLCGCSNDEVLVSPRELQMIALLVLSHTVKHADDDAVMVTRHYAYLLAKNLVPSEKFAEFEKQFFDPMPEAPVENQPAEFLLTPSREPLYRYLNNQLHLREYRRHNQNIIDEDERNAKLYGGLGGIVIEGEPGIGKSELVTAHLLAHRYVEVTLATKEVPANAFYRMPISMQKEDKERLLMKAFHEGAVVIVDEINSAPMMERLLNDLLMGEGPNGERPQNPGFMVIGTQNPITMAGRRKPSNALKRRITTIELPTYSEKELETILVRRGVERKYARDMMTIYQRKLEQAKREKLSPAPTVRDLMNAADERIRMIGKIIEVERPEKEHKEDRQVEPITAPARQTTRIAGESIFSKKPDLNPVDEMSNAASGPSFKNIPELTALDFRHALNSYIIGRRDQREQDRSEYHTFFGWLSGMSATLKIRAAEKIITALDNHEKYIEFNHDELVALKNDHLGAIMKRFESMLPEQYHKAVKKDSYNLGRRTW